jgi:hypothetical protein
MLRGGFGRQPALPRIRRSPRFGAEETLALAKAVKGVDVEIVKPPFRTFFLILLMTATA